MCMPYVELCITFAHHNIINKSILLALTHGDSRCAYIWFLNNTHNFLLSRILFITKTIVFVYTNISVLKLQIVDLILLP